MRLRSRPDKTRHTLNIAWRGIHSIPDFLISSSTSLQRGRAWDLIRVY
jgi:hypothetical protein